jgi:alcohol dehydrogenase (cytochrome c)
MELHSIRLGAIAAPRSRPITSYTLPFAAAALLIGASAPAVAAHGDYTQSQAQAGHQVFTQHCQQCHGSNLQGKAGPPLKGKAFASSLRYSQMTAKQLYHFIKTQMPKSNPGGLTNKQYLRVLSYILSKNGYPKGSKPLTEKSVDSINLLPYLAAAAKSSPPRADDPLRTTEGPGGSEKSLRSEAMNSFTKSCGPGARCAALATATLAAALMAQGPAAQAKQSAKQSNEITKSSDTTVKVHGTVPAQADVNVTDKQMQAAGQDAKNWLLHGRDYANQRFSPLKQINDDNVNTLKPAALIQTGMTASFETTPEVVDGVMYVTTPVVDNQMKIMAFNAVDGTRIWSTTYNVGAHKICCGPVNRGPAVAYGKVYVTTLDDKVIAFDAKTGHKVWEKQIANPQAGYSETMTPQVYDGKVIVGSSGGEWAIRGFVEALDAKTGKQVWKWNSTDPKSFEGDSWKSGGGMVWTTPAIDAKRGLVIFATGNPNPDLNGTHRKGDNLWTDSIVALNVDNGKLKWAYQEVKHDVWDYDAVSNVVLFDVHENGKTIPAVGEAGKVGWFFIVNRNTGKLIGKSAAFVPMSKNMFSKPTKKGVNMLPGANGGSEWSPPAYSPDTHMAYVLGLNQLMTFTTQEPTNLKGHIRLGSTFKNVKGDKAIQNGTFTAIDVDTGKIAWQAKTPQPMMGGALATAGNLVFTGEGDGWFDAFNAKSGKKLWRYNLGAGVNAPPITYEVDGTQYVAVAAGGNFQIDFPRGDTIAIFALSKQEQQQASK